jgi:5-methylcytosine-specific restriction endonuclease McrA
MLDKSKAVSIYTNIRKNGGPRHTYTFKCPQCPNTFKIRSDALKKATGLCGSCSHKKKPYESLYNSLIKDHRKIKIELTYDEFLEFTKITECHYCLDKINREPYSTLNGKFSSRAYFLDRKNNNGPYSYSNCVVCCTKCNLAKGNRYTYEEWYGMTHYFRKYINRDLKT